MRVFAETKAHDFRQDGRVFTIELPAGEACDLARKVVEQVEAQHLHSDGAYGFIKEFYGFNFEEARNLLLPSTERITVEEFEGIEDLEVVSFRPDK